MDIKVEKGSIDGTNYFEKYARQSLQKYFNNYPFVESIRVFFRGKKHPYKKVKLPSAKLRTQVEKYKSKRYKKAS